jgi:protein-tyrosine phosphatase
MRLEQLEQAMLFLADLQPQGPVYVHCVAGVERSPLVCMAWLVRRHSLSPQRALDYLMEVHPGTNPLPGQFHLLGKI